MLFTPGPVEMDARICEIAGRPNLPYFRGAQFAETVKRVSDDVKYLFQTRNQPLPITASGTGLMEMAITNLLDQGDSAIVINGGAFGNRWVEICEAYGVRVTQLKTNFGKCPDLNALRQLLKAGTDAVLVNMHETSTGFLYDIQELGALVRASGALFIVDGVSSIGADTFQMDEWGVDCALVSTQKALALLPGLGYIAFSEYALERMSGVKRGRYYFSAPKCLANITRGMTPFTPAMISILQVEERMKQIKSIGLGAWIQRHADLARNFRERLLGSSPELAIFPERSSNALTAILLPADISAGAIIAYMRETYDWWFAPTSTPLSVRYLNISHMGNVDQELMDLAADRILLAIKNIRSGGTLA
jgi:serine---pyruvate transaminase